MILASLSQATAYQGLHPLFPAAFAYLKNFELNTPDGKHEIQGKDLYAGVQRYQTALSEDKKWEAHEQYGDIQVVFAGHEYCGHTARANLKSIQPYSAEKDVEKFAHPTQPASRLLLSPGQFCIFYPDDGHQPGVQVNGPTEVIKVVIKFRL
jgi:YhcH/YjgK/YiaL family protein